MGAWLPTMTRTTGFGCAIPGAEPARPKQRVRSTADDGDDGLKECLKVVISRILTCDHAYDLVVGMFYFWRDKNPTCQG